MNSYFWQIWKLQDVSLTAKITPKNANKTKLLWEARMQIIPLHPDDRLQLKKEHPCGGRIFRVLRVGSAVRVVCETCGRDMTVDRIKLEKAVQRILENGEEKKGTAET